MDSTYCPSSGELYDFDMRRHVLSIIWGAIWFWHEKARTVHHLGSYMILTWECTYWVRAFSVKNNIAPQIMDSTCLLRSKSYSSPDDGHYMPSHEGTYCPSSEELYNCDRRGHVLSIIWRPISFWPEKARTVHHLGSYMILTWECTYCPSSMMDSTCLLMSKSYSSPDDGQYVPSTVKIIELPRWWTVRAFSCQNHIAPWDGPYCPSSGELYDFDMRRHVLFIIWGAMRFWPEKARTVHHLWSSMILTVEGTYCPSSGELHDFEKNDRATQMMDSTGHVRSKSYSLADDGQYVPSHVKII
jgi:uncharacterized protein YjiS (DUF1127 family)